MTERLADISARIVGVRQLGAVVNAMKGIAAARAHGARDQVHAVDTYAATIAMAMAAAIGSDRGSILETDPKTVKTGLLVFCAEQGFAGAFSERVLDSIGEEPAPRALFLVGTRGLSVAASRGIAPSWTAAMPSHTPGIPKLADEIAHAIYEKVAREKIGRLDVVFTGWNSGQPTVLRHTLFPLDLAGLPSAKGARPLTQLTLRNLIDSLGQDYFHAQVCKAALHAFAAENEARMQAMSSAGTQIDRELETFQATLRRVRQEAITSEIIELATGAEATQGKE
jgi:F-type H+-transporting ATPase subunit gamma